MDFFFFLLKKEITVGAAFRGLSVAIATLKCSGRKGGR